MPDYYRALTGMYMRLDQELRQELLGVTRAALAGDFSLQRKAAILAQLEAKLRAMQVSLSGVENEALTAYWRDQQTVTRGEIVARGAQYGQDVLDVQAPANWAAVDHAALQALATDMAGKRAAFLGLLPRTHGSAPGGILRQADDYLRVLAGEHLPRAMAGESIYSVGQAMREGGVTALRNKQGLQLLANGIDQALGVRYADDSLHSLHAYGQMAARTGIMRARMEATRTEFQQYGVHLYKVSTHGSLCPRCACFEGTVWAADEAGIAMGYQYCPVTWPRHPNCGHQLLSWFNTPSEGTPATPPACVFEDDTAQRVWFKAAYPERVQAARQGFSSQGEWNHTKKILHEGHGVALDELRGKRWRYADIERRRVIATKAMLENPHLPYDRAMHGVTQAYMTTPEYAKLRAETGVYSPTKQRAIVRDANKGIVTPPLVTDEEKSSLRWYTGSDYADLNKRLREGISLTTEQSSQVSQMDSALSKLPKFKGSTYRVVNFETAEAAQAFVDSHMVDELRMYHQYLSTSRAQGTFGWNKTLTSKKVRMIVNGKNGRDISSCSDYPAQQEILYHRHSAFLVKEIIRRENGGYDIILDEV